MFQELGEGTDVIHGEAREALPDGLRRRLNPPKPRGKAKALLPITCRTAIDQPLNRRQVSASCPQLLYAERKADGGPALLTRPSHRARNSMCLAGSRSKSPDPVDLGHDIHH